MTVTVPVKIDAFVSWWSSKYLLFQTKHQTRQALFTSNWSTITMWACTCTCVYYMCMCVSDLPFTVYMYNAKQLQLTYVHGFTSIPCWCLVHVLHVNNNVHCRYTCIHAYTYPCTCTWYSHIEMRKARQPDIYIATQLIYMFIFQAASGVIRIHVYVYCTCAVSV